MRSSSSLACRLYLETTFVVSVAYCPLADSFRKAVIDSPHVQSWLQRNFSAAFAGLGANLVFSER